MVFLCLLEAAVICMDDAAASRRNAFNTVQYLRMGFAYMHNHRQIECLGQFELGLKIKALYIRLCSGQLIVEPDFTDGAQAGVLTITDQLFAQVL